MGRDANPAVANPQMGRARGRPPRSRRRWLPSGLLRVAPIILCLLVGTGYGSIQNSKHDFSSAGNGGIWGSSETDRICVFCHTPHNSVDSVTPLWNRELTPRNFEIYASMTLDAAPDQPSGSSMLCLSCHDGALALDSYAGGANELPAIGDIYYPGSPYGENGPNIGGNFSGNDFVNDVSNDHPVSFIYDAALAESDGELRPPADLPAVLPLRANKVECSTCHDVHDSVAVAGTKLLRLPKVGSQLCLTCHLK